MPEKDASGTPTKRKMREVTTDFVNLGKTKIEGTDTVVNEIEGTLIEKGSIPFGGNVVGRYKLQKEDGTIVTVLGSTKMDDLLESIPTGIYIKVEVTGTVPTKGGFEMKDYKLSIEEV